MDILLRLLADLVRMIVSFALRSAFLVLGCGVRLLYWSVRQHGWGRVAGLAGALAVSLWGYAWLHGWTFDAQMPPAVVGGTAVLWLCGLWLSQRVEQAARPATRSLAGRLLMGSSPSPVARLAPHGIATPSSAAPPGGNLWAELVPWETLRLAWERVASNRGAPGVDNVTVEAFTLEWERQLGDLQRELADGRYCPQPPRWVEVSKGNGGMRRLAVLAVRDRVVQQAMLQVLGPLWDNRLASCSYAYRPRRSARQAAEAVEGALRQGRIWVVDADIESFFDRVPHRRLFGLLEEWLSDERVRWLLRSCVAAVSPSQGMGIAQGAAMSPLLANVFLHAFDEALVQAGHVHVRYADDFVILCATRPQATDALAMADRLLRALDLNLNLHKSRIVQRDEGFTFLGFQFSAEGKRPSDEAVSNLRHRLRQAGGEEERRRVLGPWQAYFGATLDAAGASPEVAYSSPEFDGDNSWRTEDVCSPPELVGSGAVSQPSPSDLATYRLLFVGREDIFARHWRNGEARQGYLPVRRSLTDGDLLAHLRGQDTLGTYLLQLDGATKAVVIDVDGSASNEAGRQEAHGVALRLQSALRQQNLEPLLLDSGGKGRHLWLCFGAPVKAAAARAQMHALLEASRPLPSGVTVEIFPKQDWLPGQALGALIRLPLGRHPETRRLAQLLDSQGRPLVDPWPLLRRQTRLDPSVLGLPEAVPCQAVDVLSPSPELAPMIEGCALLRGLVEKAARLQQLRHAERLALLYTLGHAGEAGRTYLHQVLALCANYSPRITERWVRRVEDGHRPIGCARLQEWLRDYLPGVDCACPPGHRLSPLKWLAQPPKEMAIMKDEPYKESLDDWDQVSRDLFGDSTLEDK